MPLTEPQGSHKMRRNESQIAHIPADRVLGRKGIRSTDEMRRAIESLDLERYESMSYYERWTAALEILMVEKGILSTEEIDRKMADLESETR